jgi:TPR repeat protein
VTVIRAESRNWIAYHLAVLVAHWVSRAGIPDRAIGAGAAMPASKRRRFWFYCGLVAALFAYGYAALMPRTKTMYDLGLMYENGDGVAQDYGKAREWFQKAADKGNKWAMYELGWLYQNSSLR